MSFDGIDTDKLMDNFSNKKDKIYHLLNEFIYKYKDFENDFKMFDINSNNFKEYLHTLKGISGNLCMTDIYNSAKKCEKDISYLDELKNNLHIMLANLDKENLKSDTNIKNMDKDILISAIDDLIVDIDEFNLIEIARVDTIVLNLKNYLDNDEILLIKDLFISNQSQKLIDVLNNIKQELQR